MNDPPTALVGFGDEEFGEPFCRLSMNDPPTALVGFGDEEFGEPFCRPSMHDPPTALVGFGDEEFGRAEIHRPDYSLTLLTRVEFLSQPVADEIKLQHCE